MILLYLLFSFLPFIGAQCKLFYNGVCRQHEEDIIQLYTFKKPTSAPFEVVADKVAPAADLSVTNFAADRFKWLADLPPPDPDAGGLGVEVFNDETDVTLNDLRTILYGSPSKVIAEARSSSTFSLETWIKPQRINTPNFARLFSIAWGTQPCSISGVANMQQNFQLAQRSGRLQVRLRSTDLNATAGFCELFPAPNVFTAESIKNWMHVAYVFDRDVSGSARQALYVNGTLVTGGTITSPFADLSNWQDLAGLGIMGPVACPGNVCGVLGGDRRYFNGRMRFLAFYKKALTPVDVQLLATEDNPDGLVAGSDIPTTTEPPTSLTPAPTTTTGVGGGGGTSSPGNPSGNPCVQSRPLDPATYTTMRIVLQVELPSFNCPQFKTDLTAKLALPSEAVIFIWRLISGSTDIELVLTDLTAASRVTALGNTLESGGDMAPLAGVISITDASGRVFLAPGGEGFPIVIVIAAVAGVVAIVVLVIVLCCCYKARQNQKRQYITSSGMEGRELDMGLLRSEYASPASSTGGSVRDVLRPRGETDLYQTYDNYAANQAPPDNIIALNVMQDVVDRGEGILNARRGDIAYASQVDYETTTAEWLWVKIGSKEGYVPTAYCKPRNQIK